MRFFPHNGFAIGPVGPFSDDGLAPDGRRNMPPISPNVMAEILADISRNAADRAAQLGFAEGMAPAPADARRRGASISQSAPPPAGTEVRENARVPRGHQPPPTGSELWSPANPDGRRLPPGHHISFAGDNEPELQFSDEQITQIANYIPVASRSASDPRAAARELDRFVARLPGSYFGGPHRIDHSLHLIQQYRQHGDRVLPRTQKPIPAPDISDARPASEQGSDGALAGADAFMRSAANSALAGAPDRLAGTLDAVGEDPLGFATSALLPGIYGHNPDFDRRVDYNIRRQHAITDHDWRYHPLASFAGSLAGLRGVPTGVAAGARSAAFGARRAGLSRREAFEAARAVAANRMTLEGMALSAAHGFNSSDGSISDRIGSGAVEAAYGGPLSHLTARYGPGRFGYGPPRVPIGGGRTALPEQIELARAADDLGMTIPGYVSQGPWAQAITNVFARLPVSGQIIRRTGNELVDQGQQTLSHLATEAGEFAAGRIPRATGGRAPNAAAARQKEASRIQRLGGDDSFSFETFLANWDNLSARDRRRLNPATAAALNKLATVSRGVLRAGGARAGPTNAGPRGVGEIYAAIGTALSALRDPELIISSVAGTGAAAIALNGAGHLLSSPAFARHLANTPMQLRAAATYWSRPWVAKLARANPLIAADLLNFQQSFLRELSADAPSTSR